MIDRPIFRKEALDRLASPEELDRLFTVVHLPAWILLALVSLLSLGALTWAAFGHVSDTVTGNGILVGSDSGLPSKPQLGSTAPAEASVFKVHAYFPLATGTRLREGMAAQVTPGITPHEYHASIPGRVTRVSVLPVTAETLVAGPGAGRHLPDLPLIIEAEIELEQGDTGSSRQASAGPVLWPATGIPVEVSVTFAELSPLGYLVWPGFTRN